MEIPIIDIFAGPGGLGEGFNSFSGKKHQFRSVLSIEMDKHAHATLSLRSLFRYLKRNNHKVPEDYYHILREGPSSLSDIEGIYRYFDSEYSAIKTEAIKLTLGKEQPRIVRDLINKALKGKSKRWVLLGGPPCQAFSIVGRSVMGGVRENDERVDLYKQYLRILAEHQPAAFVFENVRGLETASVNNRKIFAEIKKSLQSPLEYLRKDKNFRLNSKLRNSKYKLYSLNEENLNSDINDSDAAYDDSLNSFLIKSEDYGIPQKRHRVIIIGIRDDIKIKENSKLKIANQVRAEDVLKDLPKLRSGLSKIEDTFDNWFNSFYQLEKILKKNRRSEFDSIVNEVLSNISLIKKHNPLTRGGNFVEHNSNSISNSWYLDTRIKGCFNHESKAHIEEDIHRYLYVSSYQKLTGLTQRLEHLIPELLPKHKNVSIAIENAGKIGSTGIFNDRFRSILPDKPSPTITSHLAKDGHAFIHYDSTQARSLTVREAARIQTFPDNYYFVGGRTHQYTQVGNAVPPLLAKKIAEKIYEMIWGNK